MRFDRQLDADTKTAEQLAALYARGVGLLLSTNKLDEAWAQYSRATDEFGLTLKAEAPTHHQSTLKDNLATAVCSLLRDTRRPDVKDGSLLTEEGLLDNTETAEPSIEDNSKARFLKIDSRTPNSRRIARSRYDGKMAILQKFADAGMSPDAQACMQRVRQVLSNSNSTSGELRVKSDAALEMMNKLHSLKVVSFPAPMMLVFSFFPSSSSSCLPLLLQSC